MKKTVKKVAVFLILAIVLAGCGSSSSKSPSASYNSNGAGSYVTEGMDGIYTEGDYNTYGFEDGGGAAPSESVRAGRKLIRTVDMDVETMEFDKLLSHVKEKTQESGGYVEALNVYNGSSYNDYTGYGYRNDRNASLTLRIPKDKLDGFLVEVADNSNIVRRNEQEQDVTLDYVDLESHKEVLLVEQERILALLEQAETLDEILTLESRLSDIRYQLESMERQLRTYDNQIEYSTVYLSIQEVVELTPVEVEEKTTWERIADGFMESVKNIGFGIKEFFVLFVTMLPYLLLFAVIILVMVVIIVVSVRRGTAKRAKKQAKLVQAQQEYMRRIQVSAQPQYGQPQVGAPMEGQAKEDRGNQ